MLWHTGTSKLCKHVLDTSCKSALCTSTARFARQDSNLLQGDNDPVDVVEIGSTQLKTGGVYKVKAIGAYAMIDDGELDWKIVCIRADDPLADKINDIEDAERQAGCAKLFCCTRRLQGATQRNHRLPAAHHASCCHCSPCLLLQELKKHALTCCA